MDNNKISDVIVTLSSLYELLLNIGQSFDINENAEAFLKSLMLQKNLSFAAYYTLKSPNMMTKKYAIPKTEITDINLEAGLLEDLRHQRFNILGELNPYFKCIAQITKLPQKEFCICLTGTKTILVLGKKNASFNKSDLIKSQLVFNKFGLFMESLESHHKIKDEIKIKEEQAEIIRHNNEKLKQQNDALINYIQSNTELEKFAHRVSHDLKAPLNTIIGFSKLLKNSSGGSLTEKQSMFLKYIVDAGTQMTGLITGILSYSKINGTELKLKRVNVSQLIEEVEKLLHHKLNETSGKIMVECVPEFIIADETKIKQLFLNLSSNALKFKRENIDPEIVIKGEAKEDKVIFSIADNGIGIPSESQDAIFELFSKAENNRGVEGQGIGLSTCQQIVNQHKGEIWVESIEGEGTVFYFTIQKTPLQQEEN